MDRSKTIAFLILGGFVGLVLGLTAVSLLRSSAPNDPPCYSVQDSFGARHGSYYPPIPIEGGEVYYQTDDGWGIRFDAKGISTDRNCLRRRGVQVDSIPVEEERP